MVGVSRRLGSLEKEDFRAGVLALIDRNFQGFGKELFTDAGKYVIHFGQDPQEAAEQVQFPSAAFSNARCPLYNVYYQSLSITCRESVALSA